MGEGATPPAGGAAGPLMVCGTLGAAPGDAMVAACPRVFSPGSGALSGAPCSGQNWTSSGKSFWQDGHRRMDTSQPRLIVGYTMNERVYSMVGRWHRSFLSCMSSPCAWMPEVIWGRPKTGEAPGARAVLLPDAVFLQLQVQGGWRDAQDARGGAAVTTEVGQGLGDGCSLDALEGLSGQGHLAVFLI